MELEDISHFFINSNEFLRNVAVDNVIFGYHDKELKVLLQRPVPVSKWTVTGGYIKRTESIEEAAKRIALERTGLKDLFFSSIPCVWKPRTGQR